MTRATATIAIATRAAAAQVRRNAPRRADAWPSHSLDLLVAAVSELRERDFTAFGGRLVGRPDVIRAGKVVDYKSGAILERDDATQTNVVKAAYGRQLRIYGYLVRETLGCSHVSSISRLSRWPRTECRDDATSQSSSITGYCGLDRLPHLSPSSIRISASAFPSASWTG